MANKHQISRRDNIVPVSGQRVFSRLINGVRTYAVHVHARARIDISVAVVAAIRNRGSVWALFDSVGLEENGRDRHEYDGRILRFASEMHAPSALSATRLTSTAIGTTLLEESAIIFFSHPLSAVPHETVYRELDSRQLLQIFARMVPTPRDALVTVGGATVVVDQISLEVTQIYDSRSAEVPVFIPTVRQMVFNVPAANPQQSEFIKTPAFIRAMVIQQEAATTGEVNDIITSLALRGDFRDIIGPQQSPMDGLQFAGEFEFGGLVLSNQAYLGLNFQRSGKLSNVINPQDDVNLRFEFNALPTVAGTGASRIRVAIMELERTAGLVTPEIPFPI